ncbi:hypothetical protein B0H17DRAFT_1199933 [Mycena rosella]|uniref:Uncharacterized protein n=1 Tax=Mycena rosella TaxID=1033263 RepID=A0AAD7DJT9_MYCRO|nr:hypothetical protein B0H17DRAFT_1199933 [Mycena rosella]
MLRDLQIRVADGFALPSNRKANHSGCCVNCLQAVLKDQQKVFDLDTISDVPVREQELNSALRRIRSDVRNAFREEVCLL